MGGDTESFVRLDERDLRDATELLRHVDYGVQKASVRAVNDALRGLRTKVREQVRARYTVKASAVSRGMTMVRASYSRQGPAVGMVESTGKPVPLRDFDAAQNRRGVSARILRGGLRHQFTSAFITNIKGTTKGGEERAGRHVFIRRLDPEGPRKRVPRLEIDKLYGPSVPSGIKQPQVWGPAHDHAREVLVRRFWHHVDFLDEQGRAAALESAPLRSGFGGVKYLVGW